MKKLVRPSGRLLYNRYVDDIYVRRKENEKDNLFEALNSFHPNIKLIVEVNPSKFLDSHILRNKVSTVNFQIAEEQSKLPFHFSLKVPLQFIVSYCSKFISNQLVKIMFSKNDF